MLETRNRRKNRRKTNKKDNHKKENIVLFPIPPNQT